MTTSHHFQRTEFTTPDGLTVVGDVGGPEGAPLVILQHGGGQTRHSWSKATHVLADCGYRVVNLDARGHGESDWSAEKAYLPDDRTNDVRAVIERFPGPFALVGASMGGLTSIQAVGDGLRPSAVVLVDIVPDMEPAGVDKIQGFLNAHHGGFATLEEASDAVAAYNPNRPRPSDPSGLMKNLRRKDDGRLYWHWDPQMFQLGPGKFAEQIESSTRALGANRDIAVLVVRGLLSDIVSDEGVAMLQDKVPQTEVADVAEAGHMLAGDKNDAFNEAVIDFLARHLPTEA